MSLIRFAVTVNILFAAITLQAATTPATHAGIDRCEQPEVIRFSVIPTGNVDEYFQHYQPLLQRIEALTGRPVALVRPASYASVVEGLQSGAIDVAKIGPAGYVSLTANDPKAIPFATQEKRQGMFQREGPFYHALLVVLANSRFTNVESLKSARLALTDPGSTSGSLVPRKRFAPTLGMPLERYFSSVSHTGSHAKSITALAQGEVDAVFLASTQLEDAHLSGSLPMQQVRVLWKSEPIPFDPFVFRGQLCESLRKKIRAAFLGPESDAALKPMLDSFLHARRFVPVTDKHYAGIRALMEFER